MGDAVTAEATHAGNLPDGAKRRRGKPKSENSDLFNELLSGANQLSVAERTRLVKSLAGQLGLLTVGGSALIAHEPRSGNGGKKGKRGGSSEEGPTVRQNPLKGTKFWVDKEAAKAAMLKARDEIGGAKLPDNHPAVTAYANALKAYKDEQAKLKPVTAEQSQRQAQPKAGRGAKRGASKSPTRGGGVLQTASSFAKRMTGSKSSSSKNAMETE